MSEAVHFHKHPLSFPEKAATPERVVAIGLNRGVYKVLSRMLLPKPDGIQNPFTTSICLRSEEPWNSCLTWISYAM